MNASYVLVQVVNQWLALRLDVLGVLVGKFSAEISLLFRLLCLTTDMFIQLGFFIGAFAMATRESSFAIPAGWVGLALNYSIELTGYLKFGVRMVRRVSIDLLPSL